VATQVKLPRLGQGMESGTVVRWLRGEGDTVSKGEPLYELDTDKVTQEVEAEAAGTLLKIVVHDGEVAVGTTLAFIGKPGETVDEPSAADGEPVAVEASGRQPAASQPAELPPVAAIAAPSERPAGARIKASPLARRLARERGVDLVTLTGTGPEGRIVAEDIERAAIGAPATPAAVPLVTAGDAEQIPLTSVRKTIARRLTEAWTVPVFQLVASADMEAVNRLVERRRELDPETRVTVTDVFVKVCAAALMRHREVNVQYTEEALLRQSSANVGIAVATDRGLVVPVVHGAEQRSLADIAAVRTDLVGRARDGSLRYEDLEGGSFSVSNLGMFGLDQFTAVLNPPEAAILAVAAIQQRVVVVDGQPVVRPMVTMTLTCDHRAVDGAPAAAFLETVKSMLEDPGLAL
jgi:pyruvate dehydrogenase E2 component (dihydrolipoamide acetyltransferase)